MANPAQIESLIEDQLKMWPTAKKSNLSKKIMFGGQCWFVKGNMAFGIHKTSGLCVRCGPDAAAACLKRPEAKPMTLTGRSMSGFACVQKPVKTNVGWWMEKGLAYAASLPAKAAPTKKAQKPTSSTKKVVAKAKKETAMSKASGKKKTAKQSSVKKSVTKKIVKRNSKK